MSKKKKSEKKEFLRKGFRSMHEDFKCAQRFKEQGDLTVFMVAINSCKAKVRMMNDMGLINSRHCMELVEFLNDCIKEY